MNGVLKGFKLGFRNLFKSGRRSMIDMTHQSNDSENIILKFNKPNKFYIRG